jgi:hypothetical protein
LRKTSPRDFAAAGQEAPAKLAEPRNVSLIFRRFLSGTMIAPVEPAKPEIER